MIIGLSGYARVGKNTVADILVEQHGFTALAFADPIRDLLYAINPIASPIPFGGVFRVQDLVDSSGWDDAKTTTPEIRELLQNLGVAGREMIDEYLWVALTMSQIKDPQEGRYVITDVRFPNEASAITSLGGQIWRVERSGVEAVNAHVSETAMDPWAFDEVIVNDGSIADLVKKIKVDL